MKRLAEIQALMKEALVSPKLNEETGVLELFPSGEKRTPQKQISIYRQTVRSNLYGALKDTFPACCKVVGEDYFKQISADYFHKFPPDEPDLNQYGDKFESYLEELIKVRPEAKPLFYLPELARLEWEWYLLNFKKEGFTQLLKLNYAVHLIWDPPKNKETEQLTLTKDNFCFLLKLVKNQRYITEV